jgi:hypothetical protein
LSRAQEIGLTKEREKYFHLLFGIAYFHTGALNEAKREFEICEQRIAEFSVPIVEVYRWLSSVSGKLGEVEESQRYARLARVV